jgi:hypothetical protein
MVTEEVTEKVTERVTDYKQISFATKNKKN